jgi:hypothetical protein
MAPASSLPPSDQPRLTAGEALKQLLAIRALSGIVSPVHVYRQKQKRRIRFIQLCENNGFIRYWYYRHPYVEIVPTIEHDMKWQPYLRHHWMCESIPDLSIAGEFAAITRRAYIPSLSTQLYHQHPLTSLLKGP